MADVDDTKRDSDAMPSPVKGILEHRAFDALEKDIKEVLEFFTQFYNS